MTPDLSAATDRQLQVLHACAHYGSVKEAAHQLGINQQTARNILSRMYRRTGTTSLVQAAYLLGRHQPD